MSWSKALLVLGATLVVPPFAHAQQPDLGILQWRNVGPFRGGRATAVSGTTADPQTFFMGTAGGGIYKTVNAGITWKNISDGFLKTSSVGTLAVAASNPNIVYAGMGEPAIRANTTSHGDGIYKSTDAGKTWKNVGLVPTQVISRIRIDPTNPDIVYVAAQGAQYAPTQDRGIYRSTDGGATWKRVLFVCETCGASDLAMDSQNPKVLYASFWDHQRFPWEIRPYGPGSGIYKSSDAGDTWQKLAGGLPATMGKPSIATTSNSNRVYALVATRERGAAGIYRSDNAGATWTLTNTNAGLTGRAWYYLELVTDPTNPDVVWVLNATMYKSTDGARTFSVAQSPHGDRHDLWINPSNPKLIAVADDGGAAVSQDGGATWSSEDNQATAQIYRVVTDNRFPYWLYGAQQDNSTIAIPSATATREGIGSDWYPVAGYENSFLALDPDHPDLTYGTNILGEIQELSQSTRVSRTFAPYPVLLWGNLPSKYLKYRFILNTPVFMSPHEPKTLYVAANKLLASDDRGRSWREASPDVTLRGSDPERDKKLIGTAEVGDGAYGTIAYATESPLRKGLLWTASDDGLVGVSQDGGKSWHTSPLPGLGEARVNTIEASTHDPAAAYAAVTRFQFNDYTPYVFKTADYGRTWTRIGADLPDGAWARVVREDPVRKGLLYAGTEIGVFVSLDGGKTWRSLQNKLPLTPVYDLVVHPRGDLVVATGGRAFWILDDVTPLREMSTTLAASAVRLFNPRPAYRSNLAAGDGNEPARSFGQNPPTGALLNFYLPNKAPATIEIRNASGAIVRRMVTEDDPDPSAAVIDVRSGMNRVAWDLRQTSIPVMAGTGGGPGAGRVEGHFTAPGKYTVRLASGGVVSTAPLEIRAMPGIAAKPAAYAEQERFLNELEKDMVLYRDLARQVESVRPQVADATRKLTDPAAIESAKAYSAKLEMPAEIYRHLAYIHSRANALVPDVQPSQRATFAMLHKDWEGQRPGIQRALGQDLASLNQVLAKFNLPAIKPVVPPDRRSGRAAVAEP